MDNVYSLFIYFFIYSVIGWILEVIYCRIVEGKLYNRGFLHGTYCPIYGFGAIFIVSFLKSYYYNPFLVFILAVIVTSTLEYFTGFLLETIFKAKWWDYSDMKFNIKGRVCLLNSTLFGLLALLLIYILDPLIKNLVSYIKPEYIRYVSNFLFLIIIIDLTVTITEIIELKKKLAELKEFTEELIKQNNIFNPESQAYKRLDTVRQRIMSRKNIINNRLMKAFPNLKFKENNFEFLSIKEIQRKFGQVKTKRNK